MGKVASLLLPCVGIGPWPYKWGERYLYCASQARSNGCCSDACPEGFLKVRGSRWQLAAFAFAACSSIHPVKSPPWLYKCPPHRPSPPPEPPPLQLNKTACAIDLGWYYWGGILNRDYVANGITDNMQLVIRLHDACGVFEPLGPSIGAIDESNTGLYNGSVPQSCAGINLNMVEMRTLLSEKCISATSSTCSVVCKAALKQVRHCKLATRGPTGAQLYAVASAACQPSGRVINSPMFESTRQSAAALPLRCRCRCAAHRRSPLPAAAIQQ